MMTRTAAYALIPLSLASVALATFALRVNDSGDYTALEPLGQIRKQYISTHLASHFSDNRATPTTALAQALQAEADTAVREAFEGAVDLIAALDSDTLARLEQLKDIQGLIEAHDLAVSTPAKVMPAYPEITYDPGDADYYYEFGAYLAGECTACHSISYEFTGIPIIFGQDVSYFVGRIKDYANGTSDNQVMASVATSLDDEMLLSLAIFFAAQEPAP